jgi:hypothetical protein
MKTLKLVIVAICVSVLALFLLGAECGVPVEDIDGLPAYYIIFKAGEEIKTYTKGFTEFTGDACGNYYEYIINGVGALQEEYLTEIVAMPEASAYADFPPEEFLLIIFPGQESFEDALFVYADGSGNTYGGFENNVVITNYEDEGGVIEGTFSGTIANGEPIEITDGKFKVKRVTDDSFNLFEEP